MGRGDPVCVSRCLVSALSLGAETLRHLATLVTVCLSVPLSFSVFPRCSFSPPQPGALSTSVSPSYSFGLSSMATKGLAVGTSKMVLLTFLPETGYGTRPSISPLQYFTTTCPSTQVLKSKPVIASTPTSFFLHLQNVSAYRDFVPQRGASCLHFAHPPTGHSLNSKVISLLKHQPLGHSLA